MIIYFWLYALLLIVGGIAGYKKAGSKISLYAGVISGVVIAAGVYMQSLGLIAIVSGLLTGSFTIRFLKTKKFMPAGLLLALSAVAVVLALLSLMS